MKFMKQNLAYLLSIIIFIFVNCSNVGPDAVELQVDFTWEGLFPCAVGGNPELRVSGIPEGTKFLWLPYMITECFMANKRLIMTVLASLEKVH